ncbi:DUF552 domain-containing protein [Candidatus Woesearchaeota archaeon]|nr:DUF552 domain-containing protein [Candidatus Woesearchaeota archaeon]
MKKFMKKVHEKIKTFADEDDFQEGEEEYLELDTALKSKDKSSKIIVRPFVIEDFSDIKPILDTLREGYTIALVNIKPLKDKDLVELKRAINKLKKTSDAINGDIAGFGDDYIIITPNFAEIYRSPEQDELSEP